MYVWALEDLWYIHLYSYFTENQNHGETRHRKESIERDAVILNPLEFCHSDIISFCHSAILRFCHLASQYCQRDGGPAWPGTGGQRGVNVGQVEVSEEVGGTQMAVTLSSHLLVSLGRDVTPGQHRQSRLQSVCLVQPYHLQ